MINHILFRGCPICTFCPFCPIFYNFRHFGQNHIFVYKPDKSDSECPICTFCHKMSVSYSFCPLLYTFVRFAPIYYYKKQQNGHLRQKHTNVYKLLENGQSMTNRTFDVRFVRFVHKNRVGPHLSVLSVLSILRRFIVIYRNKTSPVSEMSYFRWFYDILQGLPPYV